MIGFSLINQGSKRNVRVKSYGELTPGATKAPHDSGLIRENQPAVVFCGGEGRGAAWFGAEKCGESRRLSLQ